MRELYVVAALLLALVAAVALLAPVCDVVGCGAP